MMKQLFDILFPPLSCTTLFPSLHSSVLQLLHPVQGRARLEPLDLGLVEAVVELQRLLAAVTVRHDRCQGLRTMRREKRPSEDMFL